MVIQLKAKALPGICAAKTAHSAYGSGICILNGGELCPGVYAYLVCLFLPQGIACGGGGAIGEGILYAKPAPGYLYPCETVAAVVSYFKYLCTKG